MKLSLINVFRKVYKYICVWKQKQKKEDWIVYILFWIGAIIGILICRHLKEESFFIYLSFSFIFGNLAELVFIIPYIIIKGFLLANNTRQE